MARITIPAAPGRTARQAHVQVYAQTVTLRPPYRYEGPPLPRVQVNAVLVREVAPPAGEDPLDRLLLTFLADCLNRRRPTLDPVLRGPAGRLKSFSGSGSPAAMWKRCRSRTMDRLAPCLALCGIFAWRLHWMGKINQAVPEAPCTDVFATEEWQVIMLLSTGQAPKKRCPASPV